MTYLHQFICGIYPYIALAIFLFGSLARFEREQYTWRVIPRRCCMRAIYESAIFCFTSADWPVLWPSGWLADTGIRLGYVGCFAHLKQMIAMVMGGIFGTLCMLGLLILLHRRLTNPRIAAVTKTGDKVLPLWIFVTLGLGLSTIFESANHTDDHMMVLLMTWAQHIVTFRGDAAEFVVAAPMLFKLHLFMGLSLFVIFPFTRLVHVWSGFASVGYISRAWQLVRPR